jgi:hypothetical protein
MTDDLVLLHTFRDAISAGAAQGELLAAGIHSLLVTEDHTGGIAPATAEVALAVHRRDAELAATVLSLGQSRKPGETDSASESGRT